MSQKEPLHPVDPEFWSMKRDTMDLHDLFAGFALAGYLASVSNMEIISLCDDAARAAKMESEPFIAKVAYTFADAMMQERASRKVTAE